MKFTIKAGKHRAWPIGFSLWRKKRKLTRIACFDHSCAYNITSTVGENDQLDWNKLFGLGYLKGFHKQDSARFAWRFNLEKDRIELGAFCHINGEMVYQELCTVAFRQNYKLTLEVRDNSYVFVVRNGGFPYKMIAETEIPFTHKKQWSYKLGPWFGGNRAAPHKMIFWLGKR